MPLKYESLGNYELMRFFPKIFHFENKASNQPGYKEVISIEKYHSRMVYGVQKDEANDKMMQ